MLAISLPACAGSTTEFFGGNFENGELAEWDQTQALPGRIRLVDEDVEGSRSGRFEVRPGDTEPDTGAQRAEVVSGLEFEEGDVRYFRILARIESWDEDEWGLIWQLHDASPNSPPLSLQEVSKAEGTLWLGPGDGSDEYWAAEIPREGEWFEVVIRVEFGKSGSVAVWLNGEPEEMANGERTYDGIDTLGESPDYDKLGIYRSSSADEAAVVYHDGYRVTDELFSDPPE